MFFHEGDEIGGGIAGQGGFGEVGILRKEIIRLAMEIGEIAAAAAGDEDFFADFFGVFQEENAAVTIAGFDGAEEAGGAGTEDDYVEVGQEVPFVIGDYCMGRESGGKRPGSEERWEKRLAADGVAWLAR